MVYQILTDLATQHTSPVLRQYKHSNGIIIYYIETVTATVTIGRGNSKV